jgi:predicted MFS family arabinose efflux permease
MIGISMVGMPLLFMVGANATLLFVLIFVIYWCYGTQLSVNGSAASDFWGTKNAGINYGMLFTAWGCAGIIGPMIGASLLKSSGGFKAPFYAAAIMALVALLAEFAAKRPAIPEAAREAKRTPAAVA